MKYPGAFILNEFGTNKELAKSYGVSERTIYRWKNKAKKETGAKVRRPTRPRVSTLQKFTGTRKELAKRYGVSERTAYRWLKKAKEQGAEIPSRQKKSRYPGSIILDEIGTNKELANAYDVSETTIKRWKRRALAEQTFIDKVEETATAFDDFGKDFEEEFNNGFDFVAPDTEEDEGIFEVEELPEYSDAVKEQLDNIIDILNTADLIEKDSAFNGLDDTMKQIYINEYINFQWDLNPYQFNQSPPDDPNGPDISDPEKIANINIWGAEFETWLINQIEIDKT